MGSGTIFSCIFAIVSLLISSFHRLSDNMAEFSAVNIAPVKWAQRKDSLYVTISLADVKDQKIDVTSKKLTFTGTSGGKSYSLNLEFVSLSN